MTIQDFLDSCETSAGPADPFTIMWSEQGRGFGQYYFYEKDGVVHIDNECDSKESIKRILCRMVDEAVLDDEPHVRKTKEVKE